MGKHAKPCLMFVGKARAYQSAVPNPQSFDYCQCLSVQNTLAYYKFVCKARAYSSAASKAL